MKVFRNYIDELEQRVEALNDKRALELLKQLIEERNELMKQANVDTLTGLNNRRILTAITYCNAAAICDIDNFKLVNDVYGHQTGDDVIRGVASVIKSCVRSSDYVCRYGGDEFVLSFPSCPEHIVPLRLENIRRNVKELIVLPDGKKNITMSFGYAYSSEPTEFGTLISKADMALYESKRNGKNRVTSFDDVESSPLVPASKIAIDNLIEEDINKSWEKVLK